MYVLLKNIYIVNWGCYPTFSLTGHFQKVNTRYKLKFIYTWFCRKCSHHKAVYLKWNATPICQFIFQYWLKKQLTNYTGNQLFHFHRNHSVALHFVSPSITAEPCPLPPSSAVWERRGMSIASGGMFRGGEAVRTRWSHRNLSCYPEADRVCLPKLIPWMQLTIDSATNENFTRSYKRAVKDCLL